MIRKEMINQTKVECRSAVNTGNSCIFLPFKNAADLGLSRRNDGIGSVSLLHKKPPRPKK
jgi:hypothetical protein